MLLTAVCEEIRHHATLRFRQEALFAAVITQTVVCLHLKKKWWLQPGNVLQGE